MYVSEKCSFRFNHTSGGNEDVSLECDMDVCQVCGTSLNTGCEHDNHPPPLLQCDECGEELGTCDCHCPKTTKLEKCDQCGAELGNCEHSSGGFSNSALRTKITKPPEPGSQMGETMEGDLSGRRETEVDQAGGKEENVRLESPFDSQDPESCEVRLTQKIVTTRQLFNCYGNLTNMELLAKYGFVDYSNKNGFVCLRHEVFDHAPEERRNFWMEKGHSLLMDVSARFTMYRHQYRTSVSGFNCPETGAGFVFWSIAITRYPWIPVSLKIWIMLRSLSDLQFEDFKHLPRDEQSAHCLDYQLSVHETRSTPEDRNAFAQDYGMLLQGLSDRLERYMPGTAEEWFDRYTELEVSSLDD
jgi:hypothetical protein